MDPGAKENLKEYLLISAGILFLVLMLVLVLFTNWIVQPNHFPPVNRTRLKFAGLIGSFLFLMLLLLITRDRLPKTWVDIRADPILLEKYHMQFLPFWRGRKYLCLAVILISLVASAVSAIILYDISAGALPPDNILVLFIPYLQIIFIFGFFVFVASLAAFIFQANLPEQSSEAQVGLAQRQYDAEKIYFAKKTGHDAGYEFSREDLLGQANRSLDYWILYVGCIAVAFFFIWSRTMTIPGAAQWTLVGAVIALFPGFFFENRYFLARRLRIGIDGLDESNAYTYLSTGLSRRSFGLFSISIAVFCVFLVAIGAGVLVTGLSVYYLFTTFLPVLLLAVIAALGITRAYFRIKA